MVNKYVRGKQTGHSPAKCKKIFQKNTLLRIHYLKSITENSSEMIFSAAKI